MRRAALLGIALTLIGSWGCGGKTTTVTGPDGEKVTVSTGGSGVALPEGFPKDIPLYPGATVAMSGKKGKDMTVMLNSTDDAQKIGGFYEGKLKENGWEIEATIDTGGGTSISAVKEKRKAAVVIIANHINIAVQEE